MSKDKKIPLRLYDIVRRPLITEKSQNATANNQYYFEVLQDASKPEIKEAIEAMFDVKVETVNTLNRQGKQKVFRGRIGRRQDMKKAIVRLKDGQTIDVGLGA